MNIPLTPLPMALLLLAALTVSEPARGAAAEASAQAGNTQASAQTSAQEKNDQTPDPAAEEAAEPTGESPDVFIPTEEISEDFAVSFPVDI